MNKPFLSGMGVSRALRSLVAFAVLFLAVGISQSFAQGFSNTSQYILNNKQIAQTQAPAGTTFVSGPAAVANLNAQVASLQSVNPQSAAQEADVTAKIQYYNYVAKTILAGAGVGDAYNNTAQELKSILNRFSSSNTPSFGALRQSTLGLVSQ